MATAVGGNITSLIKELIQEGPSFHVWQAVWLSEQITKKDYPNRKDFLLDQTGIRFRSYENYEYPPRDIKSISYKEGEIQFILNFLGLYGINSPLPRCYHEQVSMQLRTLGEGNVPLQSFFDLFNNRFYWLYYQSWKKYRFYLHLDGKPNNKITERLFAFIGREEHSGSKTSILPDFTLLKFSGILSQRVRNKSGLKILLAKLFPEFRMKIKEFVPHWVELSEIPTLGNNDYKLGSNSYIGKTVVDYMSRISIQIGEISFQDYLQFLPGTENANKLYELLKLYLNDGLEFNIEFIVKSDSISSVDWNDDRLRLGSTMWLGKPDKENVNVNLRFEELATAA
ncbi:MAG: type VI secretion system baseplate subunit TssG [Ignavibacteriales bacterium]|nr:type VI secretion system baseplate subunit TssG [Ignavibacteriales bacterium]